MLFDSARSSIPVFHCIFYNLECTLRANVVQLSQSGPVQGIISEKRKVLQHLCAGECQSLSLTHLKPRQFIYSVWDGPILRDWMPKTVTDKALVCFRPPRTTPSHGEMRVAL